MTSGRGGAPSYSDSQRVYFREHAVCLYKIFLFRLFIG